MRKSGGNMKKPFNILKRYTSLPSLLQMLQTREIVLLSPTTWDDRNDRYFMRKYKERRDYETVLALCFTRANETYHHWRVFTQGAEGVCITFKKAGLLKAFEEYNDNILSQTVSYKKIQDINGLKPKVGELPFIKRQPYADEKEFRIVYRDESESLDAKGFSFDLKCIEKITLSPWMHQALAKSVVKTIKSIKGCSSLKVYQTTLLENEQWKQAARRSTSAK
jgi:hypothetical protein